MWRAGSWARAVLYGPTLRARRRARRAPRRLPSMSNAGNAATRAHGCASRRVPPMGTRGREQTGSPRGRRSNEGTRGKAARKIQEGRASSEGETRARDGRQGRQGFVRGASMQLPHRAHSKHPSAITPDPCLSPLPPSRHGRREPQAIDQAKRIFLGSAVSQLSSPAPREARARQGAPRLRLGMRGALRSTRPGPSTIDSWLFTASGSTLFDDLGSRVSAPPSP